MSNMPGLKFQITRWMEDKDIFVFKVNFISESKEQQVEFYCTMKDLLDLFYSIPGIIKEEKK